MAKKKLADGNEQLAINSWQLTILSLLVTNQVFRLKAIRKTMRNHTKLGTFEFAGEMALFWLRRCDINGYNKP